jgi:hypothetical protein
MTRIEWLLKGDPLYSLQVARRIEPDTRTSWKGEVAPFTLEGFTGLVEFIPLYPRIDPADYRYLGQRAVMP